MDDHIGKPVNPDPLYKTLLCWLKNQQIPRKSDCRMIADDPRADFSPPDREVDKS
jgi:hypothetical protein